MKILELFSGTESFGKVARERGHEVFTIDINPKFKPSLVKDISKLYISEIPDEFQNPDVIWASPPCTKFSIATHRHWENQQPKIETMKDIKLLHDTLRIIFELHPKFWFLENPKGRMRWIMGLPPNTVYYGAYGHPCLKPTDLWGFYPNINFKEPDGNEKLGNMSVVLKRDATSRSVVPKALCLQIIEALEKEFNHSLETDSAQVMKTNLSPDIQCYNGECVYDGQPCNHIKGDGK